MELLGELHADGLTLILVTHDRSVADHGDRLLTVRDGQIESDRLLVHPEPVLVH
jgi:predicted ABC-type transport system involved in lysophospholipase L1 biosynthesis ATPase subunit